MKSKRTNTDLYKRLYRAKEFIDDQFGEQINLNQIAKEACISPYHFLRVFQKTYNKTPHSYLTERRIDKAKELLKNESVSVTEVCFDVGFESLGSFSALFSKMVGLSPVSYRAETLRKALISVNFPEKLIPGCFLVYRSF